MELMGIREYARHRGVSQAAVSKAIDSGRIAEAVQFIGKDKKKKRINVLRADQLWAENTILNSKNADHNYEGSPKAINNNKTNTSTARSVKEVYSAKMEQLKYEKMVGSLVDADDVKKAARDMGLAVRDALQYIPDKLAPILAAESDIEKVNDLLSEEIRSALDAMSRGNFEIFEQEEA